MHFDFTSAAGEYLVLYQFPPPEWFESGTTSYFVTLICTWIVACGLPGSIIVCLVYRPRSRLCWRLSMLFWGATLVLALAILVGVFPAAFLRDLPPTLAIAAVSMLIVLPFPALTAGWYELMTADEKSAGFRDLRTWGCSTLFAMAVEFYFLLPGGGHPAESYHRSACKNQLKLIGLGMHNYHDQFNTFPDAQIRDDDSPVRSWRVDLLPYLEHASEFNAYDQKSTWDSPGNLPISKKDVGAYVCASVPDDIRRDSAGRWYTAYATLEGPETAFPNGNGQPINAIKDGTSNTVLVTEACGVQIVWTEPRDIKVTEQNIGINLPGTQPGRSPATWSSYHQRGAHVLMADGAVRFLDAAIDPQVLRAIMTANGGEIVGDF